MKTPNKDEFLRRLENLQLVYDPTKDYDKERSSFYLFTNKWLAYRTSASLLYSECMNMSDSMKKGASIEEHVKNIKKLLEDVSD